jgi:ribosomal protein L11 methyltransferase
MSATYFLVKIKEIPRELEEFVSSQCFDFGAMGVSESLKFHQKTLEYDPEIIETPTLDVDVYFEKTPPAEFFEDIRSRFPQVVVQVSEEQEKDWLEEWKKGFVAFSLVEDVWIVPSWLKAPPDAKWIISMDPGMAFGTGTHETTQLASKMLWNLGKDVEIKSLLDVGTGTGVLSILAEHMGVEKIEATEIDPIARQVAVENVERNLCQYVDVLEEQVNELKSEYDVVVANIIDGVLIRISKDLKARMKKGGYILLTGVLEERAPVFVDEFLGEDKNQFKLIASDARGEWRGYLLQKIK